MSRMTEYIAIEDDNVIIHFLQVLRMDKRVIAKQCNGVAAENVTSHARRCFFLSGNLNNRVLPTSPRDLEDH